MCGQHIFISEICKGVSSVFKPRGAFSNLSFIEYEPKFDKIKGALP